jgi:hypothetical protein
MTQDHYGVVDGRLAPLLDVERATRRQADEERASLVTATRTAKRALIDLAALLGEMEAQLPESQP